jgi:hypothetical protein
MANFVASKSRIDYLAPPWAYQRTPTPLHPGFPAGVLFFRQRLTALLTTASAFNGAVVLYAQ